MSRSDKSNFGPFLDSFERSTSESSLKMQILQILKEGPAPVEEVMRRSGYGGSRFATFLHAVNEARRAGHVDFVGDEGNELLRLSSAGLELVGKAEKS